MVEIDHLRKIKRGDIVEVVSCRGRKPFRNDKFKVGDIYKVMYDESDAGHVALASTDNNVFIGDVLFCFLKVIIPVENSLPYFICEWSEYDNYVAVYKRTYKDNESKLISAYYFDTTPGENDGYRSKESAIRNAERTRDALNAEYIEKNKN